MKQLTGKQLKLARQVQDMTQEKAAKLLGISRGYLSQIENEKRNPCDFLQRKIDHYFGNIVDKFFYTP